MDAEEPNTLGDVVREESARQMVILIFSVTGTVVAYYCLNLVMRPAEMQRWRMKVALQVKRAAQWQVDTWQKIADAAATRYQKERN